MDRVSERWCRTDACPRMTHILWSSAILVLATGTDGLASRCRSLRGGAECMKYGCVANNNRCFPCYASMGNGAAADKYWPIGNKEYRLQKGTNSKTFWDAQKLCNTDGATLAIITNMEEQEMLTDIVDSEFWIGYFTKDGTTRCEATPACTGLPAVSCNCAGLTSSFELLANQSGMAPNTCVRLMKPYPGDWGFEVCSEKKAFFCERPRQPSSWTALDSDSEMQFFPTKAHGRCVSDFCDAYNAHPVTIKSNTQAAAVKALLPSGVTSAFSGLGILPFATATSFRTWLWAAGDGFPGNGDSHWAGKLNDNHVSAFYTTKNTGKWWTGAPYKSRNEIICMRARKSHAPVQGSCTSALNLAASALVWSASFENPTKGLLTDNDGMLPNKPFHKNANVQITKSSCFAGRGSCVQFIGGSAGQIQYPSIYRYGSGEHYPTREMTICARLRKGSARASGVVIGVGFHIPSTANKGYGYGVEFVNGKLLWHGSGVRALYRGVQLASIPQNSWRFFCFTHTTTEMKMYMDGKEVGNEVGLSDGFPDEFFTTSMAPVRGMVLSGADTLGKNLANNIMLDDLSIWRKVLTTAQMRELQSGCHSTGAPSTMAPPTAVPTPAPDTNPPSTAAPPTAAPTSAPATDAPPTGAPPTGIPGIPPTPAPPTATPTSAPATDAPATEAPATGIPGVPPTPAPPTAEPTSAPSTGSPPTATPPTAEPTPAPDTDPPSTATPTAIIPTAVPTRAPPTGMPPTLAPLTATPTAEPTAIPTQAPSTLMPTAVPTRAPFSTRTPTAVPTQPPRTTPPSTSAPGTFAPLTSSPTTRTPTKSPPTSAPGTEPPKTSVPKTSSPGTVLIEPQGQKDLRTSTAAANPAGGARLAVVAGFDCEVEDIDVGTEPLDWEYHPLGFGIGSSPHKYFLGAIVSNIGIITAFFLLNYLLAVVLVMLGLKYDDAIFYVRAPGLVSIPMLWLLMGTSIAAANLTFFPDRAPRQHAVIGVVMLGVCAAFPVLLWMVILRPGRFQGTTIPDPKIDQDTARRVKELERVEQKDSATFGKEGSVYTGWRRTVYILVYGREVWVRKEGGPDFFVEQYGLFFEQYREGFHWFSIVEILQIVLLSLCSVWKPYEAGACSVRNIFICIVLFLFFLAVILLRPHNSLLDKIFASCISGTMFFAVLFMTIAIGAGGSKTLMDAAATLLLVSALLMMVKGVYDIFLYLLDLWLGRRKTALVAARRGGVGVRFLKSGRENLVYHSPLVELDTESLRSSYTHETSSTIKSSIAFKQSSQGSFSRKTEFDVTPLLTLLERDLPALGEERNMMKMLPVKKKGVLVSI